MCDSKNNKARTIAPSSQQRNEKHKGASEPSGSYYYDDATGYEVYDGTEDREDLESGVDEQ